MTAATANDRDALAEEVYEAAIDYARSLVGAGWEAADLATDAATDAVMWCLDKAERQAIRDWKSFVMKRVEQAVMQDSRDRSQLVETRKSARGEEMAGFDFGDIRERHTLHHVGPDGRLPIDLEDSLTDEQAEAVRLVCVHGETHQSAADIVGVSERELRRRLIEAGEAISEVQIAPPAGLGRRQLSRRNAG
jgi:DNA-directed RNA polymerase specialized sigma24 family protein